MKSVKEIGLKALTKLYRECGHELTLKISGIVISKKERLSETGMIEVMQGKFKVFNMFDDSIELESELLSLQNANFDKIPPFSKAQIICTFDGSMNVNEIQFTELEEMI